ncbi:hypothetical protein [Ruegeria sp. HKCCD8929]|uniref:hypothetical protein n=1 Tax=Ruegeria sp. HKCCD8929 TaxID=2683006 RepID=UPI001488A2BA|nr:hypothetical protein [Ruegeria sp. HKCCD8929]
MSSSDLTDREVKKRPKPELNERWWKSAWPGDKQPGNYAPMIFSIKDYKKALRGSSKDDLISALEDLKRKTEALRKDAKSSFRKEKNREKAITTDLDKFDKLVDAEIARTQKVGTATREVFRFNFGNRVEAALKSDKYASGMVFKSDDVRIELLEAMVQDLDTKNLLNALFAEYSQPLERRVKVAATEIRKMAKERVGKHRGTTCEKAVEIINIHAGTLAVEHHKAPTNVLRKAGLNAAMEAEYKKALKKRRKQIAKSAAMTGLAGAAIALPGTQPLAIYACARSAAGLAQQIVEHNLSISKAASLLEKKLKLLQRNFSVASSELKGLTTLASAASEVGSAGGGVSEKRKRKKAKRSVAETGSTTFNALIGVDLFPTLEKATADLKTLKMNTRHGGFQAQKLIDEVMDMLDAIDDLKKIAKFPKAPNKEFFYTKVYKDLDQCMNEFARPLDKLLKSATKISGRYHTVEQKIKSLDATLKRIGNISKAQERANLVAKTLVELSAIAGGGAADASAAIAYAEASVTLAEKVAAGSIAIVGTADELKSKVKDLNDFANS